MIVDFLMASFAKCHKIIDIVDIDGTRRVIAAGTLFREGDNVRTVRIIAGLFGKVMFKQASVAPLAFTAPTGSDEED